MTFDLQAHRGGAGLHPENTLEAFGAALTLGVSTLELDVHLTRDDDVVVSHDPAIADARLIRQLGRADLPSTMPLLRDVAALLEERAAVDVRLNLEIKFDAMQISGATVELTSRADFVAVTLDAIRIDGLVERTSVQCFDWGVLDLVGQEEQGVRRNLLVSPRYLKSAPDGPSHWFDGLDVGAEFVVTAAEQGFDAISPIHGSPFLSGIDDAAYVPFANGELVDRAHEVDLQVIPYVVDDPPTMAALVRLGVDGLITNYPDRLRAVLAEIGLPLPTPFPAATVDRVTASEQA